MLGRQGWKVALAVNGKEAVREFVAGKFDLILMDVQMPEMDGLEATLSIRQEELRRAAFGLFSRIPIIALTAHASKTQHDQCVESGMDAVITKPIDIHLLLGQIREVLGTSHSEAVSEVPTAK